MYPDSVDSAREMAVVNSRAVRQIAVYGLGEDTTLQTLVSVFRMYLGLTDGCFCFILFKNRNGARKALKNPGKKVGEDLTLCRQYYLEPLPFPYSCCRPRPSWYGRNQPSDVMEEEEEEEEEEEPVEERNSTLRQILVSNLSNIVTAMIPVSITALIV